MKQIGKIGKRNIEANKILKKIFEEKEIYNCENPNCQSGFCLTFAHRHKREWYRPVERQKLLYDFNEVLLLCLKCHDEIEVSKEKTEELFNKLR